MYMLTLGIAFLLLSIACGVLSDKARAAVTHDLFYTATIVIGSIGICCIALSIGKQFS